MSLLGQGNVSVGDHAPADTKEIRVWGMGERREHDATAQIHVVSENVTDPDWIPARIRIEQHGVVDEKL